MTLERHSPCKINLLLNVLGKRRDGFHELEMVMYPVGVFDTLYLERTSEPGIVLTCNDPQLPVDSTNLVFRAASRFMEEAQADGGIRIRLEKRIPLAAGLGGGSSNAAHTLSGMNELLGGPLTSEKLFEIAAAIGSDVPFFLQAGPASVFGRGERVIPHSPFQVFDGIWFILIHPGFGISTAWAYQQLSNFPDVLNGKPGRVDAFLKAVELGDIEQIGVSLYNSLEAPALRKYPILALYQDFLKDCGALGALMSGSGSTTFALVHGEEKAREIVDRFRERFGSASWASVVRSS